MRGKPFLQFQKLKAKLPPEKLEPLLVEKARTDFFWFFWFVTGMRLADHHLKWLEAFGKSDRVNIIAPRESAKTTFLVYYMAWYAGRNPMKTNLISSVSLQQSKDRLQMIREVIQYNERYRMIFPDVFVDDNRTNNQTEFTLWSNQYGSYEAYRTRVGQEGDLKNPTFFAAGSGSASIIGKRISGILLLDDPHDEANAATEEAREKVSTWFHRTVLPCLQPNAIAAVISTRWAETDLSGRLAEKTDMAGQPIWYTIDIPAWREDPESGEKISYWPDYWPIERLEAKREEIGEILFQLMYLNNPRGMSLGHFTLEMLNHDIPSVLPENIELVVTTDLAFTEKRRSDYTVAQVIARDRSRPYNMYILDQVRFKRTFHDAISEVGRFCERASELYGVIKAVLFEQQAFSLAGFEEFKRTFPGYRAKLVSLKGNDKLVRAQGLIIKAQRGGLFINQSMPHIMALKSEYLGVGGAAGHDDTLDCGSLALAYWGEEGSGTSGLVTINLDEIQDMVIDDANALIL